VSVASTPERFAAPQYDLSLLWVRGGRWDTETESRGPVGAVAGTSGADGPSPCRYHRQPKWEEGAKRGRGVEPPGFEAGKGGKGKKRHRLVAMRGLVGHAIGHPANLPDRAGGMRLLPARAERFPLRAKRFAEGASPGPVFRQALATVRPQLSTEIVTRRDQVKGVVVLPKRWIVARSLAWLNRCRRLAKDFEPRTPYALAFVPLPPFA
jgi:hypothetical protein